MVRWFEALASAVGGRCSVVRAGDGTSRGHDCGPDGRGPLELGAEAGVDRAPRGSAHPSRAQSTGAAGPAAGHGPGARGAGAGSARRSAGADAGQGSARASPGRAGGGASGSFRGVALPGRTPEGPGARSAADGRLRDGPHRRPRRARRAAGGAKGADPILQGRAAEALGPIGDKTDAPAVGAMVRAHVAAGALRPIARTRWTIRCRRRSKPQGWGSRAGPPGQLRRAGGGGGGRTRRSGVGLVAGGVRAAACGGRASGPRAEHAFDAGTLHDVLRDPGACRGQGYKRYPQLRAFVQERKADRAVVIQAIRALAVLVMRVRCRSCPG